MAEPIYVQIMESLKEKISAMEPNQPISSERELENEYNASRMTIRKAINLLVEEGYLYRIQNVGTFVADLKLRKHTPDQLTFRAFGNSNSYRILYFKVKENAEIAKMLETDSLQPIIQIVRLNKNEEGIPESIDEIYLNQSLMDGMDLKNIHDILKFGAEIPRGSINQRFVPMVVPLQYANLLQIKINTPIICVESKVNMLNGKIFAYVVSYNSPVIALEVTV